MSQSTLGVQFYTVRTLLDGDASRAVRKLAEIGYREVERLEHHLDRVVPLVRDVGLMPVSVHVEGLSARAGGEIDPRFAIRAYAVTHVVLAWLLSYERGEGLAFWHRMADWLNEVGARG